MLIGRKECYLKSMRGRRARGSRYQGMACFPFFLPNNIQQNCHPMIQQFFYYFYFYFLQKYDADDKENYELKGQCHEIFDLYFFHESNPSGPLINRLKWFCLKIRFRKDIRIRSSKNSTPRSVILQGVDFC